MSEKLFLILSSVMVSIAAISPMFVDLPFIVLLVLLGVPVLLCIPMMMKKDKKD